MQLSVIVSVMLWMLMVYHSVVAEAAFVLSSVQKDIQSILENSFN